MPNSAYATEDDRKTLGRGWDESDEVAAKSGQWIKLNPGESVKFAIAGDPEAFEKSFTDEKTGEVRVSKRFSIDVFVPGEGLRVWEMSKTTYGDLGRQRQKRGEAFMTTLFSLERMGSGMQTKYALDYERPLKPDEIAERDALTTKGAEAPVPF